jgi:hypothetical protein
MGNETNKPLFTSKSETWTNAAAKLDEEIFAALQPIALKWRDEGYSIRHIHLIMLHCASEVGLGLALDAKEKI